MNGIFRALILLPALSLLYTQCDVFEPEPDVNIPDEAFLNALIDLGIDTNEDGAISPREAEAIPHMDVGDRGISDLTGIEAFISLERLNCWKNQLTALDISQNTALTDLYCALNQLTSLDVSKNSALRVLHCFSNQLTSLDISHNTSLKNIQLRDNPSLSEVCVWVVPFPPEGVELDIAGSPTVNFTTDCSK
jgi:Leucine-rich repeat (LRR) protein